MKKNNKAVRGMLYGRIGRAVVRRDGRIIETIPYEQLVEEVELASSPQPRESETLLAVCIESDEPRRLIVGKLYKIIFLTDGNVRLIDESGESTIYPIKKFIPLAFPPNIEEQLLRVLA